jgi:hypothetical protein
MLGNYRVATPLVGSRVVRSSTVLVSTMKRFDFIVCLSSKEYNYDVIIDKDEPHNKTKQTPWPLVRKRTLPTVRLPLVDEF